MEFGSIYCGFVYAMYRIHDPQAQFAINFIAQAFLIGWIYKMIYRRYTTDICMMLAAVFVALIYFSPVGLFVFSIYASLAFVGVPVHHFIWEAKAARQHVE